MVGINNINRKPYKVIKMVIYTKKQSELIFDLIFSLDSFIPLRVLSEEMEIRCYYNPLGRFFNVIIEFYRKQVFNKYWKLILKKRDELIYETN